MYFSITALTAAYTSIITLVQAQGVNTDSDDDNPAKKDNNKENLYTEFSDHYTFVALIDIVFTDRTKRTCTGAIIHDNVVITAAHCFLGRDRYSISKPELTASFVVIGTKAMFDTGYEQYLPIERVVTHPMFEGWTADLALVYTFAGMTSDKPGLIIPLAGDMSAHVDSNVTVYSWGEAITYEDSVEDHRERKKRKKPTSPADESCSEDAESEEQESRRGKAERFRNSREDEYTSYEDKTTKTRSGFYGKRFRYSQDSDDKSQEEKIKQPTVPFNDKQPGYSRGLVGSSNEKLSSKRTPLFYRNKYWSLHDNIATTTTAYKNKKQKHGKTVSLHKRAEGKVSKEKYRKFYETTTKMTKDSDDDDEKIIVHKPQTKELKSRYLIDAMSNIKNINTSIKPYRFGEMIDFSDSFEKELLKKQYTSKSIHHSNSHSTTGKGSVSTKKERHSTKRSSTSKKPSRRKKIKTTESSVKPKEDFEKIELYSFKAHGWRRSMGPLQNQLFVGSFGYVNIQGCRALVEKAMPPKYEISKTNDAICYTGTKRCIGENDSGAPAVRKGQLIAITIGGAQCEGDNVAVGMKMNCYCNWISDSLPPGSPKMSCCNNCCDMKHKEVKEATTREKTQKFNKHKHKLQ